MSLGHAHVIFDNGLLSYFTVIFTQSILFFVIFIITCQRWVTSPLWSLLCRVFCFYCPKNARGRLGTSLTNRQVGSSVKGSLSSFYRRKSVEHKPAFLIPYHPLSFPSLSPTQIHHLLENAFFWIRKTNSDRDHCNRS